MPARSWSRIAESMAGSRSRSASASPRRPAFRSRMTSRTQAGRGRLPMTVVGKKWRDTGRGAGRPAPARRGAPAPGPLPRALGAPHPEVELPELEGLVRVRHELNVLLEPVVLVGLDDEDPGGVLEE